jgi:hypothetical protein
MSTSFLLWNKAERKNRKRGKRKQVRRKRKNPGNLKRTKNPTALKSFLKRGAGGEGRGRRNLQHGSPTSKEEQVSQ